MKLESIDLNLLLAFDALVAERNVTRAAKTIGISQPAMSNALGRLRKLFGDPLFERVDGQMEPTARAGQLLGPIGEALAQLREALEPQPAFQPEASSRKFQIGTTDYVEAVFLSLVMRELAKRAPSIAVRTVRTNYLFAPPTAGLLNGSVDLAIGFFGESAAIQSGLLTSALFDDRFVCILRSAHPLARRKLDLRTFLEIPQIRVLYPGEDHPGITDTVLRSRGLERKVGMTVPHLLSVPAIVSKTNLMGMVPERLARAETRNRHLNIYPVPVPLPPNGVVMVWHERRQFDPAHAWFRKLIETVAR